MKFLSLKAPFNIRAGTTFVVNTYTNEVLAPEIRSASNGTTECLSTGEYANEAERERSLPLLQKPPLGRRPFLDDGTDLVNHPSHYNKGRIEVIEFLEDQQLGFHLGNVVKYIARAGVKDANKTVEDLEKAAWYLKRQIELLKAAREGRAPVRPNDMKKG